MEGDEQGDLLRRRLFSTDHYPIRRLNVYSRPDLLSFVYSKLEGTPELEVLKSSRFGALFKLRVSQCTMSSKLVHALMTRRLITKKKYEMWTVFGGKPLRFSLVEFGALTGLDCSEFKDKYDPNSNPPVKMGEGSAWESFIGHDPKATLADVANMLDSDNELPGWRKLGLALILIVDGVLIAGHQMLHLHRPTPKYVDLLLPGQDDQPVFLDFPWGRESFYKTITAITPVKTSSDRTDKANPNFLKQMLQVTFSVKGFPLVLQLLGYKCIPKLLERILIYLVFSRFLDHFSFV